MSEETDSFAVKKQFLPLRNYFRCLKELMAFPNGTGVPGGACPEVEPTAGPESRQGRSMGIACALLATEVGGTRTAT